MTTGATPRPLPALPHRMRPEDCRLEDLLAVLGDETELTDYPLADRVTHGVLLYDARRLREAVAAGEGDTVETELVRAWSEGPGIVVVEGAFESPVVDAVTAVFDRIIAQEKAAGGPAGDHFGAPGANDRIWNAVQKHAVADPESFVDYYGNDLLALCCRAWLGPGYQVTAQPNVVHPGGTAQTVHRDYHLGFMDPAQAARYPGHTHALSAALTLQGAIAHCDMPIESGPTLYLPHSQKYAYGYLAYWLPEFQDHFVEHHVQLPLRRGDLVWFNPAVFHAAGANVSSDIHRMANLIQANSAFGRAMDAVDRAAVVRAVYPTLLARARAGAHRSLLDNAVAASAEGYAFPTNLDLDQPVGSLAPATQADLVRDALAAGDSPDTLDERLTAQLETKQA